MKTKKWIVLCSVLALLLLPGCRLAQDRSNGGGGEDQFIGVVLTKEPVELGSSNRLYAAKAKEASINRTTGENIAVGDYMFAGVDGLSYFEPTIQSPSGQGPTDYLFVNEAFCVQNRSVNVEDTDNANAVTRISDGTLYVVPSRDDIIYHINPIYQEASGDVYLAAGSGICLGDGMSRGDAMSTSFDSTVSTVENGKKVTKTNKMKISIEVLYVPTEVRVFEMGTDGQRLATKQYDANHLPDTYSPLKSAAFLVVEAHYKNIDGTVGVARKTYDRGVEDFSTFHRRGDGCCVKDLTGINW